MGMFWELYNYSTGTCPFIKMRIIAPTTASICGVLATKKKALNLRGVGVGGTQPIMWIEHDLANKSGPMEAAVLQRELVFLQPWLDAAAQAMMWSEAALRQPVWLRFGMGIAPFWLAPVPSSFSFAGSRHHHHHHHRSNNGSFNTGIPHTVTRRTRHFTRCKL